MGLAPEKASRIIQGLPIAPADPLFAGPLVVTSPLGFL